MVELHPRAWGQLYLAELIFLSSDMNCYVLPFFLHFFMIVLYLKFNSILNLTCFVDSRQLRKQEKH